MGQKRSEMPARSAVERAERLMDDAEQYVRIFATRSSQQIQQAIVSFRERARQKEQPAEQAGSPPAASAAPHEESEQPVMERAEQLTGDMEQRLAQWTAVVGLQMRRAAARVREEAEDLWAEAQHLRHRGGQQ
ncbi:MAG: hypothetical protein IMW89_05295 [Ktedonobacteraceae bacterium]|nr:hypothetical protein [Ktedonobacteraceae bacterium]